MVDLPALGEHTIQIDCDVLQADGGTRTASITGAFVAVHDALELDARQGHDRDAAGEGFRRRGLGRHWSRATPVLDLDYAEDSACQTDMNVVMTGAGRFVEVQGTAEGEPFARAELDALLALAAGGIAELVAQQRRALGL